MTGLKVNSVLSILTWSWNWFDILNLDLGHSETDDDITLKYKPVNIHLVFVTVISSVINTTGNRFNYSFWVPSPVQPVTAGL